MNGTLKRIWTSWTADFDLRSNPNHIRLEKLNRAIRDDRVIHTLERMAGFNWADTLFAGRGRRRVYIHNDLYSVLTRSVLERLGLSDEIVGFIF